MKRLAWGLALLLVGCSPGGEDPRGVRPSEVLLQVSATGRAEARPDEARLTVGVSSTAAGSAAASADNSAAMRAVIAALAGVGVAADDIQTRNLTLARIDYGPQRGRYQAENLVEVRLRDVNRASAAIAAVTQAGGNVVAGPDLRVANPETANNAAYAAAYRAARARAEAYAAAAGLRVTRVLTIRDGEIGGPPAPYGYESRGAVAQVAAPAPPVQAGVSTREVRVLADFALGE